MYKKTNNTQKRRKTNNYKKRTTTNKKYDTPIKDNNDVKIVRNYEIINTKNITVSSIDFKLNLFNRKFKISTKDRNVILNKLGLKILDKSEATRFSKYYNPSEQEMLCGIFNEIFDNIEMCVNLITKKFLYNSKKSIFGYQIIRLPNKHDEPNKFIMQLPFDFNVSKFEKRINVSLDLHECLKIICICLKLNNVVNDSTIIHQCKKIDNSNIDKLKISPSINGFIYEDNKFSYGFFINNKDDKREIERQLKRFLYSLSNDGYVLPSITNIVIKSISNALIRVKQVSFDKK